MASVTQRIEQITQPKGGYLPVSKLKKIQLKDNANLNEDENIHASLIGMTVDYMTRFMMGSSRNEAFKISLKGASLIKDERFAKKLLEKINGLDDESIISACKLTGYDVCFRAGSAYYKNVRYIEPDDYTIMNIKTMIIRSMTFLKEYGPVIQDGITFEGAYTNVVNSGDADFITKDTLWDFKVSKRGATNKQTLQLLMYYLMGKRSNNPNFENITKIGIYNPRLNLIYVKEISEIDPRVLYEIERDVIGYSFNTGNEKTIINENENSLIYMKDIMNILGCSKYMVMKYYNYYRLPLKKYKNKYCIEIYKLYAWKQEKEEMERKQLIASIIMIFIVFVIAFILFFYMIK